MRRLAILLLLFVVAGPAWAAPAAAPAIAGIPAAPANSGMMYYSLAPYDLSYTLLKDVFGPVVSTVANGTFFSTANTQGTNGPQSSGTSGVDGSLLGSFFGVYNEAMLLVVAVLTLWHGVTGIAISADSGEWLGKNTSSFWAPVRVTMATGMLLPVFGGYSLVQGVIFWTILQGVGVADQASAAATTYLAQHPVVGNPSTPQGRPLAANVLADETCAYYMNNRVDPSLRGYTPSSSTPGNKWGVLFVRTVKQPLTDNDFSLSTEWYAPTGQPLHFSTHDYAAGYVSQTESALSVHTTNQNLATTVTDAWVTNPGFNNMTHVNVAKDKPLCGDVSVKIPFTNSGQSGLLGTVGNYNTLLSLKNRMTNAQTAAIDHLESSLEPLAKAFASTHMPVGISNGQVVSNAVSSAANAKTASEIQSAESSLPAYGQALGAYDAAMASAGSAAWQTVESQGNTQQIQAQIESQGWISLGDIFWVIAQNDEAIRQMINFTAKSAGPRVPAALVSHGYGSYERLPQILAQVHAFTSLTNNEFGQAVSRAAAGSYGSIAGRRAELYASAGEVLSATGSALKSGVEHGVESAGGVALGTVIGRLSSRIITGSYFQGGNPSGIAPIGNMGMMDQTGSKQINYDNVAPEGAIDMTQGDPMFEIQQMGRRMTSVGAGIVAAATVASVASDAVPELKIIMKYLVGGGLISDFFKVLVLAFIVGGFVLGVYVPMMPLIIWLTGVMAWLIMIAETMLAAPPWVVGHASLEGEGWAPRNSGAGYQMIAGLLLRPSLMVGGLLIGMLIMSAMDWLLGIMSQSYLTEIFGNGGITGAMFSLGMLVMIGGTLVFIAQTSLSLITKVPDAVLKWIGGGQSSLGADDAKRSHDAVVAGVSSRVERAGGKPGARRGGGQSPASGSRSSADDSSAASSEPSKKP